MPKFKVQTLLIPQYYADTVTEELDRSSTKKFLHLADPTTELLTVMDEVRVRFKKLYPLEDELIIEKLQDKTLCDLDPEYLLEDVLESGDELRIIVNNSFSRRTANETHTFDMAQSTPILPAAPTLISDVHLANSSRKRTQAYFEKKDPLIPIKAARTANSTFSQDSVLEVRKQRKSSPVIHPDVSVDYPDADDSAVSLPPPETKNDRTIPTKHSTLQPNESVLAGKGKSKGSGRITSGMLSVPMHTQLEKDHVLKSPTKNSFIAPSSDSDSSDSLSHSTLTENKKSPEIGGVQIRSTILSSPHRLHKESFSSSPSVTLSPVSRISIQPVLESIPPPKAVIQVENSPTKLNNGSRSRSRPRPKHLSAEFVSDSDDEEEPEVVLPKQNPSNESNVAKIAEPAAIYKGPMKDRHQKVVEKNIEEPVRPASQKDPESPKKVVKSVTSIFGDMGPKSPRAPSKSTIAKIPDTPSVVRVESTPVNNDLEKPQPHLPERSTTVLDTKGSSLTEPSELDSDVGSNSELGSENEDEHDIASSDQEVKPIAKAFSKEDTLSKAELLDMFKSEFPEEGPNPKVAKNGSLKGTEESKQYEEPENSEKAEKPKSSLSMPERIMRSLAIDMVEDITVPRSARRSANTSYSSSQQAETSKRASPELVKISPVSKKAIPEPNKPDAKTVISETTRVIQEPSKTAPGTESHTQEPKHALPNLDKQELADSSENSIHVTISSSSSSEFSGSSGSEDEFVPMDEDDEEEEPNEEDTKKENQRSGKAKKSVTPRNNEAIEIPKKPKSVSQKTSSAKSQKVMADHSPRVDDEVTKIHHAQLSALSSSLSDQSRGKNSRLYALLENLEDFESRLKAGKIPRHEPTVNLADIRHASSGQLVLDPTIRMTSDGPKSFEEFTKPQSADKATVDVVKSGGDAKKVVQSMVESSQTSKTPANREPVNKSENAAPKLKSASSGIENTGKLSPKSTAIGELRSDSAQGREASTSKDLNTKITSPLTTNTSKSNGTKQVSGITSNTAPSKPSNQAVGHSSIKHAQETNDQSVQSKVNLSKSGSTAKTALSEAHIQSPATKSSPPATDPSVSTPAIPAAKMASPHSIPTPAPPSAASKNLSPKGVNPEQLTFEEFLLARKANTMSASNAKPAASQIKPIHKPSVSPVEVKKTPKLPAEVKTPEAKSIVHSALTKAPAEVKTPQPKPIIQKVDSKPQPKPIVPKAVSNSPTVKTSQATQIVQMADSQLPVEVRTPQPKPIVPKAVPKSPAVKTPQAKPIVQKVDSKPFAEVKTPQVNPAVQSTPSTSARAPLAKEAGKDDKDESNPTIVAKGIKTVQPQNSESENPPDPFETFMKTGRAIVNPAKTRLEEASQKKGPSRSVSSSPSEKGDSSSYLANSRSTGISEGSIVPNKISAPSKSPSASANSTSQATGSKRKFDDSSDDDISEDDSSDSEVEVLEVKKPRLVTSAPTKHTSNFKKTPTPKQKVGGSNIAKSISHLKQNPEKNSSSSSSPPKASAKDSNQFSSSKIKKPILTSLDDLALRGIPDVKDSQGNAKLAPTQKTKPSLINDDSSDSDADNSDSSDDDDDSDSDDSSGEDTSKFISVKKFSSQKKPKTKSNFFGSLNRR